MSQKPTKIPAIPRPPSKADPETKRFAEAIKEALEIRLGLRGDDLDRAVTLRELIESGLAKQLKAAKFSPNNIAATTLGFSPEIITDSSVPPRPTGFTTTALYHSVLLEWDAPDYRNHGYTEIWSHDADVIGDAVLTEILDGFTYTHQAGSDVTIYYWIRFISDSGIIGPWFDTSGTFVQTSPDVDFLLDVLGNSITSSELANDLATQINGAATAQSVLDLAAIIGDTANYNLDEAGEIISRISGLETTYGDTASAAVSASAAETSRQAAEAAQAAAEAAEADVNQASADAIAAAASAVTAQTAAELAETNAETAETNAETAQAAAELASTNAATAETNAETAQTAAETAETNAETAETNAETAEANAETAQSAAETAKAAAETASTNATTAQSAAETAQAAAETASTNSATAQTAAETAQAAAETAQGSASTSNASAVAASAQATIDAAAALASQTAAETAQGASETAQTAAELAQTNAETAQAGAETAKDEAVTAQTAAETAQSSAETAQIAASTSETNAEGSASAAALSATAAATSETNAGASATAASSSASTAGTSATEAGTSAGAAETAQTAAETAQSAAETSASNAATSETNASGSAANAATSETNAATSESNAQGSANAASTSASTASTKATEAATSASAAETAQTAAETAQSAAETSETNAATSATNAAGSESSASTSASNAATSETNAGASATAAAGSASTASTKATEASQSASAAETAKLAAETAESNAQASETAAATSETNAAGSASAASSSASVSATARDVAIGTAAVLGVSEMVEPRELWTGESQYGQATVQKPAIYENEGNFVTNDAVFGNAFQFTITQNATIGQAYPVIYQNGRVLQVRARFRVTDDGVQGLGSTVRIGVTTQAGKSIVESNQQNEGATYTVADGVQEVKFWFYSAEAVVPTTAPSGVTFDTPLLTSDATIDSAHCHIRQNYTGPTPQRDGLIAVDFLEVSDVTELAISLKESEDAAGSASAAATSASNASASETAAGQSATSAQTAQTNAETAQSAAETAQTNASTSETNASGSASDAATSATNAATSESNAGDSATAASTSESNASTSASNAATSATAAETAKLGAETAQGAAATSETNAATSETNAAGSASDASTSATNAAASETNAGASATAASTDASTASTKATEASQSATSAAGSATDASTSAGAASTSAGAASTSETNAAGSASSAATSESNAATSESNALGSANAASTSASTAATKASEASTSASAAETAKLAAETAEGNASVSAANAATSETNAAGSSNSASQFSQIAATVIQTGGFIGKNDFSDGTKGQWNSGTVVDAPAGHPLGRTKAYRQTSRDSLYYRLPSGESYYPISANGKTFKITGYVYNSSSVQARAGLKSRNAAAPAASHWPTVLAAEADTNTWTYYEDTITVTDVDGVELAPFLQINGYASNNDTLLAYWTDMTLEDISSEKAAGDSASAAATSASNASASETAAGQSATSAASAQTAAETAQGAAETAQTNASTSETNASGSASDAANSASAAATSETNAGDSATAASTSESNASTSASNAATSATSAESAKTSAETAQGAAETAQSAASTSETNALGSANAAATSASNAANSESAALGSANAAATSASTASTKASEASTSASAAETAKLAAETAESNAAASETAAASSETNAAGSASAASTSATLAARAGESAAQRDFITRFDPLYTNDGDVGWHSVSLATLDGEPIINPNTGSQVRIVSDGAYENGSEFDFYIGQKIRVRLWYNTQNVDSNYGVTLRDNGVLSNPSVTLKTLPAGQDWTYVDTVYTFTDNFFSISPAFDRYGPSGYALISDLSWIDVTESTNAEDSASAAATSASNASASETAAGQSATSASSAQTAAETAKSGAETAETNASTSETNASGSASNAATSASNAATSESNAGDSATAAASSASTASTKAGEASTSASAAETAKLAAETAEGNAETSATNAATSETNAAGSASAASSSASVAATAKTDLITFDGDFHFTEGKTAWVRYSGTTSYNDLEEVDGGPSGTGVLRANNIWLYSGRKFEVDTTRTYRITAKFKPYNGNSKCYAGVVTWDENGSMQTTSPGTHRYCAGSSILNSANGWVTFTGTITGEGNASHNQFRVGTKFASPMFIVGHDSSASTADHTDIDFCMMEDITEEVNAAASASAAATSASTAQASETAASQSATTASTAANTASTKAGEASTSAGQAATSATNASGSASSAATSASNAASSETNAGSSATAASTSESNAATSATESATAQAAAEAARDATIVQNIIPDSSFELSGAAGAFLNDSGFDPENTTGNFPRWELVTSASGVNPKSGSYMLREVDPTGGTDPFAGIWKNNVAVVNGDKFTLGFWAYNNTGGIVRLSLNQQGGWAGSATTSNGQWTFYQAHGTAGAGYSELTIDKRNQEETSNTEFYIDSLILVRGHVDLTAVETSDLAATAQLEATNASLQAATSASASETAKLAAETAQGAAETAESNAATSATNASGSESAAATSQSAAATSATNAGNSASAAATSASTASTKATEASQSASTASTHANTASTKAGEASTSATNAAASETNAAGSASAASSSASVAATTAQTGGFIGKNDFTDGSKGEWNAGSVVDAPAGHPLGRTKALRQTTRDNYYFPALGGGDSFYQNAAHGKTFKVSGYVYNSSNKEARAGLRSVNVNNASHWPTIISATANTNTWIYYENTFTVNDADGIKLAPFLQINGSTAAGDTFLTYWTDMTLEDVSSEHAAADSASAAATSASAASASETAAGQSASTASTAANTATTKASEASTSASNAATSETNASGSASTASTQASNAAGSASAAAGSASAASTSASTASTKASEAAASASTASSHANTASTQASSAATYASETATASTVAATRNYVVQDLFNAANWSANDGMHSTVNNPTTGSAVMIVADGARQLHQYTNLKAGTRFRCTLWVNTLNPTNTGGVTPTIRGGANPGNSGLASRTDVVNGTIATGLDWSLQVSEFTVNADMAYWSPAFDFGPSTDRAYISDLRWEDITLLDEAATAAAASAVSGINARLENAHGSGVTVEEAFSAQASDITGLKGQYTVKIDNNGSVSGFGLASTSNGSTPTSEFYVAADKFAIMPPSSTNIQPWYAYTTYYPGSVRTATDMGGETHTYICLLMHYASSPYSAPPFTVSPPRWRKLSESPFAVISATTTISDGAGGTVDILPGVYIDTSYIADATISAAKIGALDASKISTGSLSADRIGAGTLDAGVINIEGTGGTLNIKSAASGSRMEMTSSAIKVFDGSTLRVQLGDLSE